MIDVSVAYNKQKSYSLCTLSMPKFRFRSKTARIQHNSRLGSLIEEHRNVSQSLSLVTLVVYVKPISSSDKKSLSFSLQRADCRAALSRQLVIRLVPISVMEIVTKPLTNIHNSDAVHYWVMASSGI
jgi:hypothetical protein